MTKPIAIGLVGLNDIGEAFAEHFLEQIQQRRVPIEIAAAAHSDPDSPVMLGFAQGGVAVFTDPIELAQRGPRLDVIFDLSGDANVRSRLRLALLKQNNLRTVVVPAVIAQMFWYLFGEAGELPLEDAADVHK